MNNSISIMKRSLNVGVNMSKIIKMHPVMSGDVSFIIFDITETSDLPVTINSKLRINNIDYELVLDSHSKYSINMLLY